MLHRASETLRMLTSRRLALALAAGVLVLASPALADKGGSKGKPPKSESTGKPDTSARPAEAGAASEVDAGSGRAFSHHEAQEIHDWFCRPGNLAGLPPGLAKRESLPPGLQKQLQKNGKLPPGLQKKLQPLPDDLCRRLPPLPDGCRRVALGCDVLLLDDRTERILDILRDVIPALTKGH